MIDPGSAVRVCFVCLGNICRSPTAEGVFRRLVADAGLAERVHVDSAGTGDYHVGEPPDRRASAAAAALGYPLSGRARQFERGDLQHFDLVLAADANNRRDLLRLCRTDEERAKIHLLREFDPAAPPGAEVPDPYYGGRDGFAEVVRICEAACRGVLAHVRNELARA